MAPGRRPAWMGGEAGNEGGDASSAAIEGAPAWWKDKAGAPPDMHGHGHSHGAARSVCCQPSGPAPRCDIPAHLRELIDEGVISESQAVKIVEKENELADPTDPVFRSAARGDLSQLMNILPEEMVASAVDECGRGVLHVAAEGGSVAVVTWLLDHGASVSQGDPTAAGATPLHLAAGAGHTKVVQLLCDRKVNVNAVDDEGQTALHRACAGVAIPCAALLVALGALVDCADKRGVTPLLACFADEDGSDATHGQLVALLLEMGASVNRQDADGNSALHHAAARCRYGAARALVDRGASTTLENSQKDYPDDVLGRGIKAMDFRVRNRGRMIKALVRPQRTVKGVERLFGMWATPQGRRSTRNLVFALPLVWLAVGGYVFEVVVPVITGAHPLGFDVVLRLGAAFAVVMMTASMANVAFVLLGQHIALIMNGLVWAQCALMYFTLVVWFGPRIATPWSPGAVDAKDEIAGPFVVLLIALGSALLLRSAYLVRKHEGDSVVRGPSDLRSRLEAILRASKRGKLDPGHFDFSSFTDRPLRSKHADYLPAWGPAKVRSALYARFDHYCPFSDCVVAQYNHVYFFQYVAAIVFMSALFVYLSWRFVVADCPPTGAHSIVFSLFRRLLCRPWVTWIAGHAALHTLWASFLLVDQLSMVCVEDLTTNEKINFHKYPYVSVSKYGGFSASPWSRGVVGNFARLVGGMRDPDYRKVFDTPGGGAGAGAGGGAGAGAAGGAGGGDGWSKA